MKREMILAILVISSVLLVAGGVSAATAPSILTFTNDQCNLPNVSSYNAGQEVYVQVENLESGTYYLKIKWNSGDPACDPKKDVRQTGALIIDSTKFCFDTGYKVKNKDCGEYKIVLVNANTQIEGKYKVFYNVPMVPEFGPIVGILTVLGALGVFFVVRSK